MDTGTPPTPGEAAGSLMERVQEWRKKNGMVETAAFFFIGVVYDVLTLSRIDDTFTMVQQFVYLLVLSTLLLLEQRYPEFAAFALHIEREGRLDDLWTDVLDVPPAQKSYGGAIGHVITHDMHHRAEILHIMKRLGMENLPEGDLMGWDQRRRPG